ncbi:hypothetical protein EYF80_052541 [Liparis tanakae]|uniref:Uncharacterized protein n=1 Tax=Liparis tanakae TaxID=230148 RepID=A0A4Z2F8Z9_9TELE|nr:hypothetical protein EYF80_052541 [Liparis tanakae]
MESRFLLLQRTAAVRGANLPREEHSFPGSQEPTGRPHIAEHTLLSSCSPERKGAGLLSHLCARTGGLHLCLESFPFLLSSFTRFLRTTKRSPEVQRRATPLGRTLFPGREEVDPVLGELLSRVIYCHAALEWHLSLLPLPDAGRTFTVKPDYSRIRDEIVFNAGDAERDEGATGNSRASGTQNTRRRAAGGGVRSTTPPPGVSGDRPDLETRVRV